MGPFVVPKPGETIRIPLFPLNVVLFPGARLPLRIFEPRYRKLFDDSLRQGGAFGIVLIKEGREVGGPATPFDVGTLAEIESVDYRDDSIFLLCRGTRRFRVENLQHDQPYLSATVRLLPDLGAGGAGDEKAAENLRRRFAAYLKRLDAVARALGGELKDAPGKPGRDRTPHRVRASHGPRGKAGPARGG